MIDIQHLSVERGNRLTLDNVSLTIGEGSLVALIGENGAGKSTFIKALAGQLPHAGQISFKGRSLCLWPELELASQRAVLSQQHSLPFVFGVPELVAMGRYAIDETHGRCFQKVAQYLDMVGMTEFAQRKTDELSGGELQRLQMARCLAQLDAFSSDDEGKLLILDEPTSALDLRHQHQILQLVKRFVARGNTAIIAIHDLNLASLYADTAVVLKHGRLIKFGPTKDVFQQSLLEHVYQTSMHVLSHPQNDVPMIFTEPKELFDERTGT